MTAAAADPVEAMAGALEAGADRVLLAGPTASGKSRLAMTLADEARTLGRDPMIVNADSMQVYRELAILSARPGRQDEARAAHRLFGHVSVRDPYSVAAWLQDVEALLAGEPGRLPIFVGGTGLYFDALTKGLSPMPEIDPAIRTKWRNAARALAPAELHDLLRARDPLAAKAVRVSDTQRIVRALEVRESSGRSLVDWQRAPATPPLVPVERAACLVLSPDRKALHERIARRFEQMIESGAVKEAEALMALGLAEDATAVKAIGVRELAGYAGGDVALDQAVEAAITATRRYAKRQLTWFRRRMADWVWVEI